MELTPDQNIAGYLLQALQSPSFTLGGDQVEHMAAARQWLREIANGQSVLVANGPTTLDDKVGGSE